MKPLEGEAQGEDGLGDGKGQVKARRYQHDLQDGGYGRSNPETMTRDHE